MIFEFLNDSDQLKFNNKYNYLRERERVREATQEEAETFFNSRADLLFEVFYNQESCAQIGLIYADKIPFVVGIDENNRILLLDKLSKFLRIKK